MEFSEYASICNELEINKGRYEKTRIIAKSFKDIDDENLPILSILLLGRFFSQHEMKESGVSAKIVSKAMAKAYDTTTDRILREWSRTGDLGIIAEELSSKGRQYTLVKKTITIKEVYESIRKFPEMQGSGSTGRKTDILSSMLRESEGIEARYIARLVVGDLRTGVGEGIIRDALIVAFVHPEFLSEESFQIPREESDKAQEALDIITDIRELSLLVKNNPKKYDSKVFLRLFRPLKSMLAQRSTGVDDALKRTGVPCALEYKYDGFRAQIHKNGNDIRIYTRKLEDVTIQFPEMIEHIHDAIIPEQCIIDSEFVGYDHDNNRPVPFQDISQRIKRKHGIEEMAKKLAVIIKVFDIIMTGNNNLLKTGYKDRRKILSDSIKENSKVMLSDMRIVNDETEALKYLKSAISEGHEGLMAKSLNGIYRPGARVGTMIKIKEALDTIDLVITKAEWGEGKRARWLSSYTLALYHEGEYLTIGKVGSGLKEKEEEGITFEMMTRMLKQTIIKEEGRTVTVKPTIIVEIRAEEIQKSDSYSSGYALRFPRIISVKEDRQPNDTASLEDIRLAYETQKGKTN